MKRLSVLALAAYLAVPSLALAQAAPGEVEKFNPEEDFAIGEWVPIKLGPLDLSINRAVAYLIIGAIVTMALGIALMRIKVGPKN